MIGTTTAGIGVGALVGWSAGSAAIGALVGAVIGIPARIFVVYRRYRVRPVSAGTFTTPRPAPSIVLPIVAGTGVIVLALPIYLIAGWRIEAWALAATLWAGSQAFSVLLVRLRAKGDLVASASPPSG